VAGALSGMRREVYREVGREFKNIGLRKKSGEQVFRKVLAEGIDGSLDVTSVTRGEELAVSLGVGFRVPEVERLISEWLD
jgi:hypothetical protein